MQKKIEIVVEKNERFNWVRYIVVTPIGRYTCFSLATAKLLVKNLRK